MSKSHYSDITSLSSVSMMGIWLISWHIFHIFENQSLPHNALKTNLFLTTLFVIKITCNRCGIHYICVLRSYFVSYPHYTPCVKSCVCAFSTFNLIVFSIERFSRNNIIKCTYLGRFVNSGPHCDGDVIAMHLTHIPTQAYS